MSSWDFTTVEQSEPSHSPVPKISFFMEQSKPSHSPVPKTFLLSDKKGTDSQSLSLGPLLSPPQENKSLGTPTSRDSGGLHQRSQLWTVPAVHLGGPGNGHDHAPYFRRSRESIWPFL